MSMNETQRMEWQSVMLICPQRVECDCGAKALFVVLDDHDTSEGGNEFGYVAWCRDCWEHEQKHL